MLKLEDKVKIGETPNEEAFRLICEEVEKLVKPFSLRDYKMQDCVYGISANWGEGVDIINVLAPDKIKHIGNGILKCTSEIGSDIVYVKLIESECQIKQLTLEELNVTIDDYYENWIKTIFSGWVSNDD